MRIALVTLLCTFVLTASGGTGARADDKAEVEKELKKFQGTWTVELVEAEGKEVPISLFTGMTVTFEGDKYTVKTGPALTKVLAPKVFTVFAPPFSGLFREPRAVSAYGCNTLVAAGPDRQDG